MARARKELFYEHTDPSGESDGCKWLLSYDNNSRSVVDYLTQNGAGATLCRDTICCFEKLRDYLQQNSIDYSAGEALRWFENTGPYPKGYQTALSRLQDLFYYGEIQPGNSYPLSFHYYPNLIDPWKRELDDYLLSLKGSRRYREDVKSHIARFFYRLQSAGVNSPSEITFELLEKYIETDPHKSHRMDTQYAYENGRILAFMASKGLCTYGLGWYPYFRMRGRILLMQDLSENQVRKIESLRMESLDFPSGEYAVLIPGFLERLRSLGYSNSPCKTAKYTLYNLLVFLEMHGLGYHIGIAKIWLEHAKDSDGPGYWGQKRRVLNLFELYTKEGDIIPQTIFREKPLLCESLPEWCRSTLDDFLLQKEKEGWEMSTLTMYRSSATRFCLFVVEHGAGSFADISPELIKEFNRTDPHMTAEGKNAYNVRIRKFLQFLERQGQLPYGTSYALYCTAAAREKTVVTLSAEGKAEIARKNKTAGSGMELRNRAILLIGIKMGLRASDIVKMGLSDIDWNRQTIRVCQKKTGHEVDLPMPTEVGNAIYLYLKKGRPETECRSVFVKVRVPYY